jgi:hypothetical protein
MKKSAIVVAAIATFAVPIAVTLFLSGPSAAERRAAVASQIALINQGSGPCDHVSSQATLLELEKWLSISRPPLTLEELDSANVRLKYLRLNLGEQQFCLFYNKAVVR